MSRVIFHMEDRGHAHIYHWFMYMVAGLRHVKNGTPTKGTDGGGSFERNHHNFNNITKQPYNILFKQTRSDFHDQTISILSNDFIFLNESDLRHDDIIINNYGEAIHPFENDDVHNSYVRMLNDINSSSSSKEGYMFLKSMEDSIRITDDDILKYKDKRFFLSRNRSHNLAGNKGIKRRQILNEDELTLELSALGIKSIFLEDYSVSEKIKLFKLANMIISPNSGGLLFCVFSNKSTQILELNVRNPSQVSEQYHDICRTMDIPYHKFHCDRTDNNDNMHVDVPSLIRKINSLS